MNRKAPTAHGEIEYETVTCASCDNEVAKQDAEYFVIGDLQNRTGYSALNKQKFEFADDNVRTGWACPYCADDPVKFPVREMSPGQLAGSIIAASMVATVALLLLFSMIQPVIA